MNTAVMNKVLGAHKRGAAHPEFRPGDTIRVHVKIREGDKERLQAFEGTVIAQHNSGAKLYYLRGLKGKASRLREREAKPETGAAEKTA